MTRKTLQTRVADVRRLHNVTRVEALGMLRDKANPKEAKIYQEELDKVMSTKMTLPY